MEDDLNGRQPHLKMTLKRRSHWKITLIGDHLNSMEDILNVRQPQWKTTSIEDNLHGRQPQWKTTSMEDNLSRRRPQCKTTI